MPALIRLHALGGLSVRSPTGQPIAGAAGQPRRMAVLALIARAGDRGISRDKLLALLWPDADDERGPRTLTQALYALRRDLGSDDAIAGTKELRLEPTLVTSDVADFTSAVARGDDERAAELYAGPFLDGFHLPDADLFSRWVEQERSVLENDSARVLESLARACRARGDDQASIGWWRKLAARYPLNARVTVGLMEALASSGDRAAALSHARVYEALLAQELDAVPDREVFALAARLRNESRATPRQDEIAVEDSIVPSAAFESAVPESAASQSAPPAPVANAPEHQAERIATPIDVNVITTSAPPARRSAWRVRTFVAAGVVVVVIALGLVAASQRAHRGSAAGYPIIAVGRIIDYGTAPGSNTGRALGDMIGTNLARSPGLRVVSGTRMYELIGQLGGGVRDTSLGSVMTAARRAGATEMIDGSLYQLADGAFRLDLRRTDLVSGSVQHADQIEGRDIFALADSSSLRIVKALGATPPRGSLADVTTRSALAYSLYEEGLRAHFSGERALASSRFAAALAEDSTFAMAEYFLFLAGASDADHLARSLHFSGRASERERLIIRAAYAAKNSSPDFGAIAESLVTRYPDEIEGHLYRGQSLQVAGEFLAALPSFRHVLAMDSASLNSPNINCAACQAYSMIVVSYELADSLDAAELAARAWLRSQPSSSGAHHMLGGVLELAGKTDAARTEYTTSVSLGRISEGVWANQVSAGIRALDFKWVDAELAQRMRAGDAEAFWWSSLSLRAQGRLQEALAVARRRHSIDVVGSASSGQLTGNEMMSAQILFEAGQYRAAAALFDSLAQISPSPEPSARARQRAWMYTHGADARAIAGDTSGLGAIADTIQLLGAQTGYARDHLLYHHVRALLLEARGRPSEAAEEYRRAIFSPTFGFTRTNVGLARVLLALGKPLDAVATLRSGLHGGLDAANLYVTQPELHELLAHAWEAAGNRDSAAVHYRYVTQAYVNADPMFATKIEEARRKIAQIKLR